MKAAEWVPAVYVSDAMENALKPAVLSSWNINTLASSVCGGEHALPLNGWPSLSFTGQYSFFFFFFFLLLMKQAHVYTRHVSVITCLYAALIK